MFAMEGMMKKEICVANTTTSSAAALAMHKDSQMISKVRPKIRIIHLFAPEIIKTDVANFRELVQRLTGKPTESNKKKKPRIPRKELPKKIELLRTGFRSSSSSSSSEFRKRIKGEEELWGDQNPSSSGGFLGGFADLDGFMQELNEFPLFPLDASSHMDSLGEPQLASS